MVKVLNTNGILTLSDFVHALRHGSIAEQIQDEKDKCSFTGSLGCPQLESCAIDHDHRGIILRPVFRLRTDPICEDIVIQEDTVICHRSPEPSPTPINRPKKHHHHHHVQKVTHHHRHKHNCSRRKAPVRSQSITNRGFQPASHHYDTDICPSVYYTPRSPKNTVHHCKHLSRSNRHRLEASKMEYAKRKIHFASPEVAHVQQIYSAEPSEIAIMEENHQELQQKESDIFTHRKLAVKKEGNTGSIREVFSNGDAQSQNPALQSTVKERAETEELSPNHETQNSEEPDLNEDDENHHEIIEPSAKKTSYTQVTSREDEIIEKNFEKSVQVTDGLHQSRMYRFNDDAYSVSSRTLPKSTFRSEVYRPDDDGEESSLASDESCDCCCEIKVPPRVDSLQKASPPPVPPHRMHLQGSEESGVRRNRRNYPKCSGGFKWERDFQSTDDSSMLSRLGARLIGSRTSNTNTSVSEGDYCVHEN